jgi:hypothetical protein
LDEKSPKNAVFTAKQEWQSSCSNSARGEQKMEAIVLSATLVGSLGTAYVIQRAILGLCLKAICITRREE